MKSALTQFYNEATTALKSVSNEASLKSWHDKYLGRHGALATLLSGLKDLSAADKKVIGPLANKIKSDLTLAHEKRLSGFVKEDVGAIFDATLPGLPTTIGHLHPLTKIRLEVEDIFRSMGFTVHEGPEMENDYFNFEALNIPDSHPARESMDTFWLKEKDDKGHPKLLRTHTSAAQARLLASAEPPIRAIVPGRCFRNEATDASHEHTFYQVEGLVVDREVSIANLSATLRDFLSALFETETTIRLRPGFFPFVEPGFEVDFQCVLCHGKGCSVCKRTGWVELIPCGLVHPKVFAAAGYQPGEYTGFAFAMGLDRVAMMRYGIDDIRYFHSADLKFLKQF